MSIDFQITALPADRFDYWRTMSDAELRQHSAQWVVADSDTGYPCRVSLEDARTGERVLAIPFSHHEADSFYRASGPIFIREQAQTARIALNIIPSFLMPRMISARAYDRRGMMLKADAITGDRLGQVLNQFFSDPAVINVHLHNARTGCYLCQAERAEHSQST